MFQKLKDKIAEEVKQSPLKFQTSVLQLTQAVSSSTSLNNSFNSGIMAEEENEDEETGNEKSNDSSVIKNDLTLGGSEYDTSFTTIDLRSPTPSKNRRSSSASTINSELFPIYEFPPSRYNLQSDLESNSEFDDGSSIQQFGNVSKENLYQKYRTVLQKYHKYHCRFVDMQKYCQELQREYNKAKTILTETQDKAIRRIAELREQCTLEQKAKAHLEDALQNELEERDHVIDTLNTKIKLLKMGKDCEQIDQVKVTSDASSKVESKTDDQTEESNTVPEIDSLRDKIKNFELLLSKAKDALTIKKNQIEDLQKTIESNKNELKLSNNRITELQNNMDSMKKKEEEALLSLAENKLIIHKELEAKESQIKSLEDKIEEDEKEIKKLKMKLESEKKLFSEVGTENNLQDDDIQTLQKELNHLKLLRNDDQIELKEKNYLLNEFKTSIDYSNQELMKLKNEIKTLNFTNKPVDSEIRNLRQELADSQSTIKKLELSLSNKQKEFGLFCAEKDSEMHRLHTLQKSQADNIVKLEEEILICRSELSEKIKFNIALSDQIKTLNDALEKTNSTLNDKTEQLKLSTDAVNRSEAELLSVNNKLKDTSKRKKFWEEAETNLKADKIVLEETMKNLRNELTVAQAELKNAKSKIEKYEEEIKISCQIINEKRILEGRLAEAEAQLEQIKLDLELKQKIEQEIHVQTANYLEEINSLKSKEDDYLSEIRKLKTNIVMLQKRNEDVTNLNQKLNENIMEYERSCEENKDLKDKNDSLENEIVALRNEISKMQELFQNQVQVHAENDALKLEQENWEKKVEELQISCESHCNANKILKTNIGKLQKEFDKMETFGKEQEAVQIENAVLKENMQKLQVQIVELLKSQEVNEYLGKENKTLRAECENLKRLNMNIVPMQEENASLKTELQKLQKFVDRFQEEIGLLRIKLQETQSKLIELQDSYFSLVQEHERVQNNACLNEELKYETERKIEHLRNELVDFQATAERLQNENNTYTKVFDDIKLFINEIEPVFEQCCRYKETVRCLEDFNEKIIREREGLLKDVSDLRSKSTAFIDDNKVNYVQDILVNFKRQISDLKQDYKLLQRDLNSHLHILKQYCDDCKMEVNNGTRTIIQNHLKLYSELENRFKNLENEYEALNDESIMLKNEKQVLFNKTDHLSNKFRELEEQVSQNKNEEELKRLKDKYSEEIREIIAGYEMRLSEKDNEYEELQNKLFRRNDQENIFTQQETKEIIQTLQEDLTNNQDSYEELLEKYQHDIQELNKKISEVKENYAKELRESDKKWRSCLDKKIAEIEEKYKEEINELTKEWSTDRKLSNSVTQPESILPAEFLEDSAKHCENSEILKTQVQILSNELSNCKKSHWRDIDLDIMNVSYGNTHSDISLEDCTEMEYLRNILFEYMMGHQPMVLAKVLAALVKFDNKQTKQVLQNEEQKQSLLGQLRFS